MPRLQTEYILKGIFLGLLLYVATDAATRQPAPVQDIGIVALCTLGGLALALLVTGVIKVRQGFQVQGRWLPFILFLLLESPTLTYLGVLGGAFVGTQLIAAPELEPEWLQDWVLLKMVGGGIVLGIILSQVREIKEWRTRVTAVVLLGVLLVWGAVDLFGFNGKLPFIEPMEIKGEIDVHNPGLF